MYDLGAVIGNKSIIKSLKQAVEHKRVNHAYIFDGLKGSGRKTLAYAFAKTLNCKTGTGSPCGSCISCKTFDSGNNPDVIFVKRSEGEREIKIDAVRNIINKNIAVKPYSNRYKVFIIEDADRMNTAAQNAFLKTLEEPPYFAVFLLITENCSKLLPTVLSRCQHFRTENLPAEEIKKYLVSRLSVSDAAAYTAAVYSGGSIGRAAELALSEEFGALCASVAENTIKLLETDLVGLYKLTAQMEQYKDNIESYLDIMYLLYRDCLVYMQTGSTDALVRQDITDIISRICTLTGTRRLIRGCSLIEDALENLRRYGDFQLVIENLFFKLKEK